MAKTTPTKALERTYTIPLRKEFSKVAKHKRTNKAVKAVKEFLKKHMKSEEIKLGKHLNDKLWKHGIKNPPHHVKVITKKDSKGVVKAELFGKKIEEKKEPEKKSKLQAMAEKAGVKMPKKEEKKETKSEEPKKETTEVSAKGNEGDNKSPGEKEIKKLPPENKEETKPETPPKEAKQQSQESAQTKGKN